MFKVYTRSYYGSNALSSCYTWDFSENIKDGFGVAVLIKNSIICGKVSLSGMIARASNLSKIVKDYVNDDSHIQNIGVLIEDLESNIRSTLDVIYISKSKEIIDTARFNPTLGKPGIAQALKLKEVVMGMKK